MPADAVAAVDRDVHPARELHIGCDSFDIRIQDARLAALAFAGGILAALNSVSDVQDLVAVKSIAADHDLQPVVVGRVWLPVMATQLPQPRWCAAK
jgi:hypothetical protein